MKKTASLLTAFCLAVLATANPVGKQAALYTAQTYMLEKGKTVEVSPVPFHEGMKRKKAQSSDSSSSTGEGWGEAFYVFNAGSDGGYVIVSADDRTEPILGYVEQGTFDPDNIPENMRSWLQSYADQIKYIVDNDIQPGSPLLKKRNKVQGTRHSIPEILTTRWNQGHPYNLTCPHYYTDEDNEEHEYPATGCTATAMAQVMNFYKYPAQTKAEIPALTNKYTLENGTNESVTTLAIPANTIIDWEEMSDTYNCYDGHAHTAQEYAVANLMLYCGQAVGMSYGESSSANFSAEAFINYFGYDDSAFVGERYDYTIDDWFNMLYDEIEAGYPVLFSGFSSGGGHAFVLDGFDGDNLFHVNWGWGGSSNGWFLVGILNPDDNSGIGASSSSDGYSMSQRALFNLRLPDDVTAEPATALTIDNVEINGTKIKCNFINWTGFRNDFNGAIVKLNDDGTLSPVGSIATCNNQANNSYFSHEFEIKNKLPQGTYKLSPASKLKTANVWHPKYNMRNEYIEAVVKANKVPTLRFVTPTEDISIEAIEFPGTRIFETEQEVKVTFRNNKNDEYYREIYLFAGKTEEMVYTESRSLVTVRASETVQVSFFFTPEETGTYNLWFCTSSDGSGLVGTGTMEVITKDEAVTPNLYVSDFTVNNATNGIAYGERLVGKVNIRNRASEDFNGKVLFQIWSYKAGDEYVWSGPSKTVSLSIAAGQTVSAEFNFDNLSEGYTYYLPINYVGQEGELAGAGIWDHEWYMENGVLTWNNKGTISGWAYNSSLTTATNACGLYADCSNFTRLTPNSNPNTIYALASNMSVPSSLGKFNAVSGNHANSIKLVNDKAFYVPVNFKADEATFTYTFPATENGTGWHAFTLPFKPTEISEDGNPVTLDDENKHFWIYEFAAQGDNGEVIFAPATELRGSTPYIIAADASMAGRAVTFSATDVPFYKNGSDKMVVTSSSYKFFGTTLAPTVKDCYILNADGTAFEYITTSKTLTTLTSYFTTTLPDKQRLQSIVLPEVPRVPGDVNGDGEVDLSDAIMVTYYSLHVIPNNFKAAVADMNGDGEIDLSDAIIITYMSLGVK